MAADTSEGSQKPGTWILDTGATSHYCNEATLFTDLEDFVPGKEPTVTLGDGHTYVAKAIGLVQIVIEGINVDLNDVLYVPDLQVNLLSASAAARCGMSFKYTADQCEFFYRGEWLFTVQDDGSGLVKLFADEVKNPHDNTEHVYFSRASEDAELWHRRLGHLGYKSIYKLKSQEMLKGIDTPAAEFLQTNKRLCDPCAIGKSVRSPFTTPAEQHSEPLFRLSADVCGPFNVTSVGGSRYFLAIVDEATKYRVVVPLRTKGLATDETIKQIRLLENQTSRTVKRLRTDNGREFVNKTMDMFLTSKGIHHELTHPHSSQQNGRVERGHRTDLDGVRTLLVDAKLPPSLWAEALVTTTHLHNVSPVSNSNMTPHEALFGTKPDVRYLRAFGCKAVSHINKAYRGKLDARGEIGTLVGYAGNRSGYRLYANGRVWESRDVVFDEHERGMTASSQSQSSSTECVPLDVDSVIQQTVNDKQANAVAAPQQVPDADQVQEEHQQDEPAVQQLAQDQPLLEFADHGVQQIIDEQNQEAEQQQQQPELQQAETRTRSGRISRPPRAWWIGDQASADTSRNETPQDVADDQPEQGHHQAFTTTTTTPDAPEYGLDSSADLTLQEALRGPDGLEWRRACEEELAAFVKHDVMRPSKPPPGATVLKLKWILTKKLQPDGTYRYKARLCAKGYEQKPGIDYKQLYAPGSMAVTVRTFIAVGFMRGRSTHLVDIKTAFLHGRIKEDIWVEAPEGFDFKGDVQHAKLYGTLYGLKQAPHEFHEHLKSTLHSMNLQHSLSDPTLFTRGQGEDWIAVLHHTDDVLIQGADKAVAGFKAELSDKYSIRDYGDALQFLHLQLDRHGNDLKLHQQPAIIKLLNKHNLTPGQCKTKPVPISTSDKVLAEGDVLQDKEATAYRSLVGSLNYIAHATRPDLSYTVSILTRFFQAPTTEHMKLAKACLCYLAATSELGIIYKQTSEPAVLEAYSDANYAGSPGDGSHRKSTQAHILTLNGSVIDWRSKLQSTLAQSTTDAEYIAAAEAARQGKWVIQILNYLHEDIDMFTLHVDNQSAITIAENGGVSERTKHLDVKYHYIKELIDNKSIRLRYLETSKMPADILTKAVTQAKLQSSLQQMNMQ